LRFAPGLGANQTISTGLRPWLKSDAAPRLEELAFLNHIIGGWQINGLFDASTGNPLTFLSGRRALAFAALTADGLSTVDFIGDARSIRPTKDAQRRRVLKSPTNNATGSVFPLPAVLVQMPTGI
jgi:hypothetical protein